MLNNVRSIVSCFVALSFAVVACGDGDSDEGGTGGGGGKGGSAGTGGASGKGGSAGSSAGKGGTAGSSAGTAGSSAGTAGSSAGTAGSNAGTSGSAGSAGSGEGGMAGAGEGGTGNTGTPGGSAGEGGVPAAGGTGGDAGGGGAPEGGVGGEPSAGAGGTGTAGEGGVPPVGGAGGAGGEGGAPVVVFDTIENPSFETGTADAAPPGWTVDGPVGAAVIKTSGGHTGTNYLNLWLGSAYTVDVFQEISPIPNGTYTLSIWHYGGAYNDQYVYVTGYNQANLSEVDYVDTVSNAGYANLVIEDIVVTSGQITIGVYSDAAAGNWSHFDDVSLTLNPE